MHFACIHCQVDAPEDFAILDPDVQVLDFQQTHSVFSFFKCSGDPQKVCRFARASAFGYQ
jgi:hypothetical protein